MGSGIHSVVKQVSIRVPATMHFHVEGKEMQSAGNMDLVYSNNSDTAANLLIVKTDIQVICITLLTKCVHLFFFNSSSGGTDVEKSVSACYI